MSKKLLLAATLFFTLIMMCFSVSASDVNALAFSSTGYDGDEVQIFSPPDSGTLSERERYLPELPKAAKFPI